MGYVSKEMVHERSGEEGGEFSSLFEKKSLQQLSGGGNTHVLRGTWRGGGRAWVVLEKTIATYKEKTPISQAQVSGKLLLAVNPKSLARGKRKKKIQKGGP